MKSIRTIVFEKRYEVFFKDESNILYDVIYEQLSYYPQFPNNEASEVIVNICKDLSHHKIYKKNPSIHWEIENGFIAVLPTYKVAFYLLNQKLHIDLSINTSGGLLLSLIRKFINMEFATREERIAETLFESVLVPSIFFDSNKFLVHSSGFVKDENNIIVGGTGGSGKTSLEIELCLNKNYKFVNDDIAVISNNGSLLPNLAHPKIYGYNVFGNPNLKKRLLENRSLFDRFHWWFTYSLLGSSKVRRRLFLKDNISYTCQNISLTKFFILSKDNVDKPSIKKISPEHAAELNLNVMLAEYNLFINHFYWHEFNSILDVKDPIIKYEKVRENLLQNSLSVFENTNNYIIRIPLEIDHSEFLKSVTQIIEDAE
jgi:hypothetical protein